jgi:actin-like ATPase involved in cell morphogenesis
LEEQSVMSKLSFSITANQATFVSRQINARERGKRASYQCCATAPRDFSRSALSGEIEAVNFMKFEIPKPTLVSAKIGTAESQVVAEVDGRAVYSHHFSVGTQTFGESVIGHFRHNLNLLIGERTAEAITIAVGSAFPEDDTLSMEVRGRDTEARVPRIVTVTEAEISAAISKEVETIVGEIKMAIEHIPTEAQAALADWGVRLQGEGAWLRGLDKRVMLETNLPVVVAEAARGK